MTDSTTCPGLPEIMRVVSGASELGELQRFSTHLQYCPNCQETMRRLQMHDAIELAIGSDKSAESAVLREIQRVLRTAPKTASQERFSSDIFDRVPHRPDDWSDMLQPPQADDEIGRLGPYRVLRVLGRGGMGTVFVAEDVHLERKISLKLLKRDLISDADARHRFMREARTAAAVKDDHIVTIYQVGQAGNIPYIAMELLEGETLDDLIRRSRRLPIAEVLRIGREIATGLATAHEAGLIHRDIKPANIWLEDRGSSVRSRTNLSTGDIDPSAPTPMPGRSPHRVKILDFGIARLTDSGANLTGTGQFVGTPNYIAPEQAAGDSVDGRADLFSLGCVLYEMLSGVRAFPGESVIEVLRSAAMSRHRSIQELVPEVPRGLVTLVDRLLEKDPKERPSSAAEVVEAFRALEAGLPVTIRRSAATEKKHSRRWFALVGVWIVTVLGVGLWAMGVFRPAGTPKVVGPTGVPIKVGLLFPSSGRFAVEGSSAEDAVRLAIEELNAANGVLGRPIEIVQRDNASQPELTRTVAQDLIEKENVRVIFGPYHSPARRLVRGIVEKDHSLLMYPTPYEGLGSSPNMIFVGVLLSQKVDTSIEYFVRKQHKKRIYLVGTDNVFGHMADELVRDELKTYQGIELVNSEFVLPGEVEGFGRLVEKVRELQADLVIQNLNGESVSAFYRAFRPMDKVPILSFNLDELSLRSLDIDMMRGHFAANAYFQSLDQAENHEFLRKFKAKYGTGRVVGEMMAASYSSVHLWAKAVERAKTDEPLAVRKAFDGVVFEAPGGRLKIDPETGHVWRVCRVGKIVDGGQFEIVWSNENAIKPAPFPSFRTQPEWMGWLEKLQSGWDGGWENPKKR